MLWRLQTACSYTSMPVSFLVLGSTNEKKFTLTLSTILCYLEILLYPRNGCALRRNELIYTGGQDKKLSAESSCASTVLRTVHRLTFLILVTTLLDKPCYYPRFTDGNSGAMRLLPNRTGSMAELGLYWAQCLQSPQSHRPSMPPGLP